MSKRKKTENGELKRKRRSYDQIMEHLAEGDLMPAELAYLSEHFSKKGQNGVDIGYLKTVLFPEQYSYDIPFPLTSVSFCKFTDKQEIIVNTGTNGEGMLLWYPRTTCGPQLFQSASATTTGLALNATNYAVGPWVKVNNYFNQVALVAASISVQYVGKVENEAGLMVGGHLYGLTPAQITTDEIENSQWVTRARPGEGLRFVYLPRDSTDFEFYQTAGVDGMLEGTVPVYLSTSEGANKSNLALKNDLNFKSDLSPAWMQTKKNGSTQVAFVAPVPFSTAATTTVVRYVQQANCIGIYWSGMDVNNNWLRVDIARKFDGIPQSQYRDIMEMTRPLKQFDEKKTFNVLNTLCQSAPIGGHTLKEVDRIVDRLAGALPNVSYLMENGGIKQVGTLSELADVLEHPNIEEKGLGGPATGEIGRIYHYF